MMPKDWSQLYLLGWYDQQGKPYLSTWDGDRPMVSVVVYGATSLSMPLWDADVPSKLSFEVVPNGVDPQAYAQLKGGLHAFGWFVAEGFRRKSEKPRSLNGTPFVDQMN